MGLFFSLFDGGVVSVSMIDRCDGNDVVLLLLHIARGRPSVDVYVCTWKLGIIFWHGIASANIMPNSFVFILSADTLHLSNSLAGKLNRIESESTVYNMSENNKNKKEFFSQEKKRKENL